MLSIMSSCPSAAPTARHVPPGAPPSQAYAGPCCALRVGWAYRPVFGPLYHPALLWTKDTADAGVRTTSRTGDPGRGRGQGGPGLTVGRRNCCCRGRGTPTRPPPYFGYRAWARPCQRRARGGIRVSLSEQCGRMRQASPTSTSTPVPPALDPPPPPPSPSPPPPFPPPPVSVSGSVLRSASTRLRLRMPRVKPPLPRCRGPCPQSSGQSAPNRCPALDFYIMGP